MNRAERAKLRLLVVDLRRKAAASLKRKERAFAAGEGGYANYERGRSDGIKECLVALGEAGLIEP